MFDGTKKQLKAISKIGEFKSIMEKITLNKDIDYAEKSFILSIAILFAIEYEKDKRFITFLDLSYYLLLKYSLITKDYKPLYDFSVNF